MCTVLLPPVDNPIAVNKYIISFPAVQRGGRGVDHQTTASAKVKERVQLYSYPPSGPLWPVTG
jgi:hypothetical protein